MLLTIPRFRRTSSKVKYRITIIVYVHNVNKSLYFKRVINFVNALVWEFYYIDRKIYLFDMTPLVNYQFKKYISKANFAVEKHRALNT